MNKTVIFMFLIILFLVPCNAKKLSEYKPLLDISTLVGYSPQNSGMVFKSYANLPYKKNRLNYLYCSFFFYDDGEAKGVEFTDLLDEPYDWWNETSNEIESVSVFSVGVVHFLELYPNLGFAGHIGFGEKQKTTQYISSVSNTYFYKKNDPEDLIEFGADFLLRRNVFVFSIGYSIQSSFNVCAGLVF